jgi:hypothetical protein
MTYGAFVNVHALALVRNVESRGNERCDVVDNRSRDEVMVGVDDTLHAPPFALPAAKPGRGARSAAREGAAHAGAALDGRNALRTRPADRPFAQGYAAIYDDMRAPIGMLKFAPA